MAASTTGMAPEALAARVQELTHNLEAISDPFARTLAEELAAAIVELYGEGLVRICAALDGGGPAGAGIRDQLTEDGVVASLMLIHDLYPVDLETRVREGLDTIRPYMESHGGNVELLGIADGVARLRLEGSCHGCAASAQTLELAIKQAIEETAPDLAGLEVEGVVEQPPRGGFSLPIVQSDATPPAGASAWLDLDGAVSGLQPGNMTKVAVGGSTLLVANVNGTLLAYLDTCAACGATLHDGELRGGVVTCHACARRFYLPNAGRSVDHDHLQLEPVPLLAQADGAVQIALAR